MSIRAYKIESIKLSSSETFNLWHCPSELNELLWFSDQLNDDGAGYIEISKEAVETAMKECKEDETKEILKDILKDIGEDEHVQYSCF